MATNFGIKSSNPAIKSGVCEHVKEKSATTLKTTSEKIVEKKVKDPKTGKIKIVKVKQIRKVVVPAKSGVPKSEGFGIKSNKASQADYY